MIKQLGAIMSFSSMYVAKRTRKDKFYTQVNQLIDWRKVEKQINKSYKPGKNAVGREAYPGLLLFKMLLLGIWNGLSDYGVEDLVNDSLSASKFCGLTLEDEVPDHSVLSRFRSELTSKRTFDKLLKILNKQLEQKSVMVKTTTKVDASITNSPRKPSSHKTYQVLDNDSHPDDNDDSGNETVIQYHKPSVDQEAGWTKKGGKFGFGYKRHDIAGNQGLIIATITTAANTHDHKVFEDLVDKANLAPDTEIQADKAYYSNQHNEFLHNRQFKNGLQIRAKRGKPLTKEEKQHNNQIAKTRYMIERTFGSIKRWFKAGEARYVGLEKTHSQHVLESIAYNLKRLPNLALKKQVLA